MLLQNTFWSNDSCFLYISLYLYNFRGAKKYGLSNFELVVCDEAHSTTGATLVGDDESSFVKIHSKDNVNGVKRIYMTATPRIYRANAKTKADDENFMDDESTYGPLFFYKGFGWAVANFFKFFRRFNWRTKTRGCFCKRGSFRLPRLEGLENSNDRHFKSPMFSYLTVCLCLRISQLKDQIFQDK